MSPLSTWDHVQLRLLRWLGLSLAVLDKLLKVRWGERFTDRLTERWQGELNQVSSALARLEKERQHVNQQIEAMAIHAAAIYLAGRQQANRELRFDPADAHDERLLDATIDTLVKARLAEIEEEEIEPGRYTYSLEPDWARIRKRLASAAEEAEPELAEWLYEGVSRIEEKTPTGGGD